MADKANIPILSGNSISTKGEPRPVFLTPDDLVRCEKISAGALGEIQHIAREVSEQTGLRLGELLGPSRKHPIAHARQIVMFVAHRSGFTPEQIARALRKDRTTIIHGVRAEAKRRGGK